MSVTDRHTNATLQLVSDDSSTPLRKAIEFSLVKSPKTLVEHGKSMQQGNATVSGQIVRKEADGLPDLCLKPDLCLHLHQMYKTRGDMLSSNMSICVSIQHKTKTFKNVLYQQPEKQHLTQSVSLEKVISGISATKPIGGLTGLERVQLALSLAKAVLKFHASPWLPENWRIVNVRFSGVDSSSSQRPGSLKAPFLNLKIVWPLRRHSECFGQRSVISQTQ